MLQVSTTKDIIIGSVETKISVMYVFIEDHFECSSANLVTDAE